MRQCYIECWQVLFRLLFSVHIIRQCHPRDLRPYVLSWTFLFLGPFFSIPLQEWSRVSYHGNRPGIYPLFLVWFRVAFSLSWDILCYFLSFISTCLIMSATNIPTYWSVSFSLRVHNFSWFGSSIPFNMCFSRFSLLAWRICLCKLCLDCILLLLVLWFSIIFSFWQRLLWCHVHLGIYFFLQFTMFVTACTFLKYLVE